MTASQLLRRLPFWQLFLQLMKQRVGMQLCRKMNYASWTVCIHCCLHNAASIVQAQSFREQQCKWFIVLVTWRVCGCGTAATHCIR